MYQERISVTFPKHLFTVLLVLSLSLLLLPTSAQTVDETTYVISISEWSEQIESILVDQNVKLVNIVNSRGVIVANKNQFEFIVDQQWPYTILKQYTSPADQEAFSQKADELSRVSDEQVSRVAESLELNNGSVGLEIDEDGTFTIWRSSDNRWLLYPATGTGYFSVNVDNTIYSQFDGNLTVVSPLSQIDGNTATITYQVISGITITQIFKLEGDAVGLYVSVGNDTFSNHHIQFRYLLDTQIDNNDGSPLYAPPVGTRTYETEVSPLNFSRWEAWLTPVNPSMKGIGTLTDIPSRIVFAWWPNAVSYNWDYTPNPAQPLYTSGFSSSPESDGCVLLYYDMGDVPAQSQTTTTATYYGIGDPTLANSGEQLKATIDEFHNALKDYYEQTVVLHSNSSARAYNRILEDITVTSLAIDLTESLLADVGIAYITGRFLHQGAIKGSTKAFEIALEQLTTSGLINVFPAAMSTLMENLDPSLSEPQMANVIYSYILNNDGWDFGDNQVGLTSLLSSLDSRFTEAKALIPDQLPDDYPLEATVNSLKELTQTIKKHTPWNGQPTREGQKFWHVPGICDFQLSPLNPMFFGTSSNAARYLNATVDVYDVQGTISEMRTYGCIGWTGGGAIAKGVASLTVVGALPAEGVYWAGVGACGTAGTVMGGVELTTKIALLFELWDAEGKVASDIIMTRDFTNGVLDDIVAAVTAPSGASSYYACSPDVEVISVSIPDLNLGFFDETGAGTAHVTVTNNDPMKSATAQVYLQALVGQDVIGVYTSQVYTFSPGATIDIPIDFEVPNSNLFLADKYTARFVTLTSGSVIQRLSTFRVCSPIACFVGNPWDVLNGTISAGQEAWAQIQTTGSERFLEVLMTFPGSDIDLHIYDQSGNHVGVNYSTGQIELGISGAVYSGAGTNPESIRIPNPGSQLFDVQVVGVTMYGSESFDVIAIPEFPRPAVLTTSLFNVETGGEIPDTVTTQLLIGEIGGHQPVSDITISITDLISSSGHVLSADSITTSISNTEITADENALVTITIPLYESLPSDTFLGSIEIGSSANALSIPIVVVTTRLSAAPITGFTTADGVGVHGVLVELIGEGGTTLNSAVTDENGYYEFIELDNGPYIIMITPPLGLISEESIQEVELAGFALEVNFELMEVEIVEGAFHCWWWKKQFLLQTLTGIHPSHIHITPEDVTHYNELIFDHFYSRTDEFAMRLETITYMGSPARPITYQEMSALFLAPYVDSYEFRFSRSLRTNLLNIASGRMSQTKIISTDGATASQAITYLVGLFQTGERKNMYYADVFLQFMHAGWMIPAGYIDLTTPNIMYKDGDDVDLPLPTEYSLHQNYPNPFNPTTEISFSLPTASNVSLVIYNITGQKITTLASSYYEAGRHIVSWDAGSSASGIYFYRLQVGNLVETKKMVLLK